MSVNIYEDRLQHASIFGKDVLFTNWLIARDTVPKTWYCYDLRGTEGSPNLPCDLVDRTTQYHAGTILSAVPLKVSGILARKINGTFYLHVEELTLDDFCQEHGFECPQRENRFALCPASSCEVGIFYALTPEEDGELGTIGHVRIDFGDNGREFRHSWHPRASAELNNAEFRAELSKVMDELRGSVLSGLSEMRRYCQSHGGEIGDGQPQNYGYIVDSPRYRYCLRCNPVQGDYQAYLICYDKQVQEMNLSKPPGTEMTLGGIV